MTGYLVTRAWVLSGSNFYIQRTLTSGQPYGSHGVMPSYRYAQTGTPLWIKLRWRNLTKWGDEADWPLSRP